VIKRTALQELVERLHTVASVAEQIKCADEVVRAALQGTADAELVKLAEHRARVALKTLKTRKVK